ncbi:MAG: VanR-ABDEGLN family response regulator transcription factor [Lachnospiraceae bacterium]|nr:VanR-ABDEGLN family response regulator transcription factor [Lachnospiraceae bacterium]
MEGQILIVDDEKEITDLLEVYLKNEGFLVHKFYRAEKVMRCIEENEIDLAILDVMLPDEDGFSLCRRIREHYFFPILMLTAKVADTDKIQGITMGADDYVTKPFNPLEVVARVKGQLRRVKNYDKKERDGEYRIRGLELLEKEHRCRLYEETIDLTPIEFSILLYLCRHAGEVVSSEELFERVWGEKYLDNNNTVMAHIARLRDKLHENSRKPEYIKTVWGVGYKMEK